jgi:hypothetical protein
MRQMKTLRRETKCRLKKKDAGKLTRKSRNSGLSKREEGLLAY